MQKNTQNGFSLIELLVVVVLIGVAAGITSLSLGTSGHSRQLEDDSRYLYSAMQALLEEAVITQNQFAVQFDVKTEDGQSYYSYTFLVLDQLNHQWLAYQDEGFASGQLDPSVELSLVVDDTPVVIGGQKKEDFFALKQNTDSDKPALLPDIYFLSSGETQNFVITLKDKQDESQQYHIKSNLLGQMELIQGKDEKQ